jgi:serine/threonine protein kinase
LAIQTFLDRTMEYVEKYEGIISSSANSVIVKASRKSDGLPVILKKLASKYPEPWQIESLRLDYNITQSLYNSNKEYFLNLLEIVEDDSGSLMLVEEDVGEGLTNILAKVGKFNLDEFLKISIEMSAALHYVHMNHVIHRDIKVGNFIIDSNTEKPKLIDFGISVVVSRKSPFVSTSHPVGTFAYMSPEQTGRISIRVDSRSDVYSLGITFYEMLSGKLPYQGDKLGLVHAQITKKLPDITDIPPVINGMLQKMCAKNPNERYQSALGVQRDLESFLKNLNNLPKEFAYGQKDVEQFKISDQM